MKQAKHIIVKGRVQGVFFRRHTLQQAQALKLTGWVRNLPTGEVECMVYGDAQAISTFSAWLHQGPPAAAVTCVTIHDTEWQEHPDFSVR